MKKTYLYLPIFLGVFFAAGILLGHYINDVTNGRYLASNNSSRQKLNRLIDLIENKYVDDIDTDSIVDATVLGIMQNLDPHSVYIPSDRAEAVHNDMRGDFVGIGIKFFVNNDTISVTQVFKDGPSDEAGIRSGDKILTADGRKLYGENGTDSSILKGKDGTRITLGVLRPGDQELLQIPVTRGKVALRSVDAAYMLSSDLGYIKVNRFAENTIEEFDQAIETVKKAGATSLVLDLRDNPGGILTAATHIADEFLQEDKLILFQKDRNNKRIDSYATDDGDFEDREVYILINENSASASEIVAGALQDNDIGIIVGRRSFGKGLVQQEMKLGDGSSVRLTVARYYTPTGRSIQRPYDMGKEAYFNEYINRYQNGELIDESNIEVNDSLKRITPGGKVVYGGGGIVPDVFVPSPDGYILQTLDYFARTGFADRFTNMYLQEDGAYLFNLSKQEFLEEYEVPEPVMENFIQFAQLYNTSIKLPGYRNEISLIIKSSIAEQLFGTQLKVKLINQEDNMIKKVLQLHAKSN
ncbi:S41 family peptidase [Nonlabens sp. SCSIO 43208]|uniref:S41 family peptidase n=1 Tax=Nonlabens sp. SCSIO 43208 TaxID=2793009 RepID=UPI003D6BD44E